MSKEKKMDLTFILKDNITNKGRKALIVNKKWIKFNFSVLEDPNFKSKPKYRDLE